MAGFRERFDRLGAHRRLRLRRRCCRRGGCCRRRGGCGLLQPAGVRLVAAAGQEQTRRQDHRQPFAHRPTLENLGALVATCPVTSCRTISGSSRGPAPAGRLDTERLPDALLSSGAAHPGRCRRRASRCRPRTACKGLLAPLGEPCFQKVGADPFPNPGSRAQTPTDEPDNQQVGPSPATEGPICWKLRSDLAGRALSPGNCAQAHAALGTAARASRRHRRAGPAMRRPAARAGRTGVAGRPAVRTGRASGAGRPAVGAGGADGPGPLRARRRCGPTGRSPGSGSARARRGRW
jgi:hypothetical protein